MLLAAGILGLLIWGYLLLARGGFWRIHDAAPPASDRDANKSPVRIAVITPARNEADVVGRAIRSLLQQARTESIHIFLIDDGSTDGTAQAAREAAALAGHVEMLTICEGKPLAPGWSGKLWAMQQGVELARTTAPDFFLFTDADIEHAPGSVSALVQIAQCGPYDLA